MVVAETVMPTSVNKHEFVVHLNPVRRDRADFIINANIEAEGLPRRFEQLWVRRLDERRFELCCIPFFIYDLALGDELETTSQGDREHILARVVRPSGGYTFRAWFGDSSHARARDEVIDALCDLGSEFEWHSGDLLAIDAADDLRAQDVADFLREREQLGHLVYETGRTN